MWKYIINNHIINNITIIIIQMHRFRMVLLLLLPVNATKGFLFIVVDKIHTPQRMMGSMTNVIEQRHVVRTRNGKSATLLLMTMTMTMTTTTFNGAMATDP